MKSHYKDVPRVCIVGGGIGGIAAGALLKKRLQVDSFTIFDTNHDFGGTWLTTKYPGLAADLPAWLYGFNFELNLDSQKLYPDKGDFLKYLMRVAREYQLYGQAKFNTVVNSITWEADRQSWSVISQTTGQEPIVEEYNIVIMATGTFRVISYPEIFKIFTGTAMHSSQYDANVNIENKVVGVVGCGATGAQIIPAIAPLVKQLICYQRSASYQAPKFQIHTGPCVRTYFKLFPCFVRLFLVVVWFAIDMFAFLVVHTPTFAQWAGKWTCLVWMKLNIHDPALVKALTPGYKFGGRIPTLSDKYYSACKRRNVTLVKAPVVKVEGGDTILTEDGGREKLDVLILCTGFKVQDFFAPIKVSGLHGQDLLQLWKEAWPKTYYGTTCSASPNMFFLGGPNSICLTGWTFTYECQMNLVLNILKHMMTIGAHAFQVTNSAEDKAFNEIKSAMEKSLFGLFEKESKLTNQFGENTLFWPGTSASYWWKTKFLRKEHFKFFVEEFGMEDV